MNYKEVQAIIQKNQQTLKAFGLSEIGVFGSVARGEETPESDIDLLVTFLPGMKTWDRFFELSEFLKACLGKKIDIVTPESLSPYMKPQIEKEIRYERL